VTCSAGSAAYGNAGLLTLCGHLQGYLTHVRAVLLGFALFLQSSCGCVSVPAFLTKTLLQGFVAQRYSADRIAAMVAAKGRIVRVDRPGEVAI
jgi:hypothetical protein